MRSPLDGTRKIRGKDRRGAAAVEFALVAPLFVLLVFGMVEYGRMVMVQQVLTNAAREGARQSILDGSNATTIKQNVVNYLTSAKINNVTTDMVAITPTNPASAAAGTPITLTISVPYSNVSWLPASMFSSAKERTLSASSVMRRESVQ